MTYSEAISSLALLVALASFVVAYLSFRRTSKLDEPNAWMELKAISEPNCWKASIHLKNPTRYPLKLEAVSVPLSRVPVDEKQDFLLAESEAALKLTENESRIDADKHGVGVLYIKMPIPELTVAVGSEGVVQVILVRGSLSVASEVTLTLHYWAIVERPRYRTQTVRGRIPTVGIALQVQRT